jgi:large subunit ribosomal protein L21
MTWLKAQEATLKALAYQHPPNAENALFVVVNVKGKQYKVSERDVINAEHIPGVEVGALMRDVSVLVVAGQQRTLLGRPFVQGANVALRVEEHCLDRKVIVFKKRRRKRYQRTQGHRRMVTRLRVEKIDCDITKY